MFRSHLVREVFSRIAGHFAKKSRSLRRRSRRLLFEEFQPREVLAGQVFLSELHPSGSGHGTYAADWFEVTNAGTSAVNISGWKMDDNSNSFGSAVALRGVTSIPAGKSAVFFEGNATGSTDAAITAAFSTAWFGTTWTNVIVVIPKSS